MFSGIGSLCNLQWSRYASTFFYKKVQTLKCFNLLFYFFINKKCIMLYRNKNNTFKEYFLVENILLMFWQNYFHDNADVI